MVLSKPFKDKEDQALKDLLEVRRMRNYVEDNNEYLKEDDTIANMQKELDEQMAENQRVSDENKELKVQNKRLDNKALMNKGAAAIAEGRRHAANRSLAKLRNTLTEVRTEQFELRVELINLKAQPNFYPKKEQSCGICFSPTDKQGYYMWKDCGHSLTCNLCFYKQKMTIKQENGANAHIPGYEKKHHQCIWCQRRNDKYIFVLENEEN